MIGAVVGTQPFGGRALSGTGPKAGGPNYLRRFATEQTVTINTAAAGGKRHCFRKASDLCAAARDASDRRLDAQWIRADAFAPAPGVIPVTRLNARLNAASDS
jgi:delta 1-pyrroline-5-carboxylate dehydrogenase